MTNRIEAGGPGLTLGSNVSIAVVGAGLSGLAAARELQSRGAQVKLFEKARGPGGRLATRRVEIRDPSPGSVPVTCSADFGAQFFSVFSEPFGRQLADWQSRGLVTEWFMKNGTPRYRAVPTGMNGLAKDLARGLSVHYQTRITDLKLTPEGRYRIRGVVGGLTSLPQNPLGEGLELGEFDGVILSAPLEQSLELVNRLPLKAPARSRAKELNLLQYHPCIAWMGVFAATGLGIEGTGFLDSPTSELQAVASSRLKGLNVAPGTDLITVHLSPEASLLPELKEDSSLRAWVLSRLQRLGVVQAQSMPILLGESIQRWRLSQPTSVLPEPFEVLAPETARFPVLLCGDIFGGPRVEGAYLSGWNAGRSYDEK